MRYFKHGEGEYGYGDKFIGIRVPDIRKEAIKDFKNLQLKDVKAFLKSPIHEFRLYGLLILV